MQVYTLAATRERDELKQAIASFDQGLIQMGDLKKISARFGIYEQADRGFMIRVRTPGGEIALEHMRHLTTLARRYGVGYAHLTTRQDIQLHDVSLPSIMPIVEACIDRDIHFRGGGGDTYRNIVACPHSGLSAKSVFDVYPYIQQLNRLLLGYDDAFNLPRKFKIGFSCCDEDGIKAVMQDLGFIARIREGVRGFAVWGGGGMGRESMPGIELLDFMPVRDLVKCTRAMIDLFFRHGNREQRNQARLRFLPREWGAQKFRETFAEYFATTDAPFCSIAEQPVWNVKIFRDQRTPHVEAAFEQWRLRAVQPVQLGSDMYSVKLYIPFGNMLFEHLDSLNIICERFGIPAVRLTPNQNILIPLLHASALPRFHQALLDLGTYPNWTGQSFKGQLHTCIGANVCKIGVLDAQGIGREVAEALDLLAKDHPELATQHYNAIIDMIRISGCSNACGGHPSARLGFQGCRKKTDQGTREICKLFQDARLMGQDPVTVSHDKGDDVPREDIPLHVCETVKLVLGL